MASCRFQHFLATMSVRPWATSFDSRLDDRSNTRTGRRMAGDEKAIVDHVRLPGYADHHFCSDLITPAPPMEADAAANI